MLAWQSSWYGRVTHPLLSLHTRASHPHSDTHLRYSASVPAPESWELLILQLISGTESWCITPLFVDPIALFKIDTVVDNIIVRKAWKQIFGHLSFLQAFVLFVAEVRLCPEDSLALIIAWHMTYYHSPSSRSLSMWMNTFGKAASCFLSLSSCAK